MLSNGEGIHLKRHVLEYQLGQVAGTPRSTQTMVLRTFLTWRICRSERPESAEGAAFRLPNGMAMPALRAFGFPTMTFTTASRPWLLNGAPAALLECRTFFAESSI